MTAADRRNELWSLLGTLPDRNRPITATKIGERPCDGYTLETLVLDLNGIEPVPAYFVRPDDESRPRPTLLYHHSHGGHYDVGKDELIHGKTYLAKPPYAAVAAELGFNALCIDCWNFGQRRGRSEHELFCEMLWKGQVLYGQMAYDAVRSVDYLLTRDDVDSARIVTGGISMGSTLAWWAAALDERIAAVFDIGCMTDFDALIEARGLREHGVYYYVPGLLEHFTTAQINELIVPRPHLCLAGNYDRLTPPAGLDRVDAAMKKAYAAAGAAGNWRMIRRDIGHMETDEFRAEIAEFLKRVTQ
jgi:dienelactone hydrolase